MIPLNSRTETIWVGARLRPLNEVERLRREEVAWAAEGNVLRCLDTSDRHQGTYAYDAVYGPKAGGEDVYRGAARDRVLSALQGLNATLFVYGQTGSGKTHTMRQAGAVIYEEPSVKLCCLPLPLLGATAVASDRSCTSRSAIKCQNCLHQMSTTFAQQCSAAGVQGHLRGHSGRS